MNFDQTYGGAERYEAVRPSSGACDPAGYFDPAVFCAALSVSDARASRGLSNLSATALTQDSTGFLWVGTQNGLFRYDGSRFDVFDTAQGLPSAEIVSLADSGGTLLAATTGGVAFFTQEHFVPVRFNGAPVTTTRRQGVAADDNENVFLATSDGLMVRRPPGRQCGYKLLAPITPSTGFIATRTPRSGWAATIAFAPWRMAL
jgi:ligand-binding sensor domain-containing protein